ncbi:hypothetical protein KSP39_PZI001554 [Platanthera zijinensis]|uniref:Uncharacterized protein n=1 Tax=Platanthera zijinensis TaxID=2320716 RepID=A0AAP0GFX3_9ASPA
MAIYSEHETGIVPTGVDRTLPSLSSSPPPPLANSAGHSPPSLDVPTVSRHR